MGKNLVRADGTCNAFGATSSSNVARLIEYLDLDDARKQIALYDQGLGTLRSEYQNIERFKLLRRRSAGSSEPERQRRACHIAVEEERNERRVMAGPLQDKPDERQGSSP